jgi:membrane-associated protease RseP (regulator of RpoE activity)
MTIGSLVKGDSPREPTLPGAQSALRLGLILAVIVFIGFRASWGVVAFIVALLLSVVAHEAGHYVAARTGGMKVTEFFVGFGPRIWSTRRGETEYGFKALPLGAYVKVPGMSNLEEVPPEDEARTYRAQSYGRRVRMVFAGPAMNLLVALVLFIAFFAFHDETVYSDPRWPAIEAPDASSPAGLAGLRQGDRLLRLDGVDVTNFNTFRNTVRAHPGEIVPVTIERDDRTIDLTVTLGDRNPGTGESGIGYLGVAPQVDVSSVHRNLVTAVPRSFEEFGRQVGGTVEGIGRVFSPSGLNRLYQTVTGQRPDDPTQRPTSIVGIVRAGGRAAETGFAYFIYLLGAVNLALGLFNLLPLLPLDGGHIAIASYERLRSRRGRTYRVDMNKVLPLFVVPLLLLFTVVIGAFWLDITGN